MRRDVCGRHITILLVDDHRIVREGLRSLLEQYSELEVVAEADSGEIAVSRAIEYKPDVVVMDITLPGLNGIEATRRIIAGVPGVKVIALSMHSEKHYVMEMIKSGASGYLLKERAFEELVDAICDVVVGNTFVSSRISSLVEGEYDHGQQCEETPVLFVLTPREREVLRLIAEGRSTLQIAASMNISTRTVETHRQHIMDKLNIRGIAELTRYAIRQGIIPP